MTDKPKKPKSTALRDAKIRAMAAAGDSNVKIGAEVGLDRREVSRILTSDETKAIIEAADSEIKQMITEAVATVRDAMAGRDSSDGMGHALKAAIGVLKNYGLLKESVDLNHRFPKPTVIRRPNGEVVELGAEEEK